MGKNEFEIIFTSNYIMNIQDRIVKVFGSIERAYHMVVNYYFGPRRTNIPHATPNYGPLKSKFEVYYYRLREPIGSLVFENPRSRLRGKPTNPEIRRVEKVDNKLICYRVRGWIILAITWTCIW